MVNSWFLLAKFVMLLTLKIPSFYEENYSDSYERFYNRHVFLKMIILTYR